MKVLALSDVKLFLDPIINLTKCFPHLETLYIKVTSASAFSFYLPLNNPSIMMILLKLVSPLTPIFYKTLLFFRQHLWRRKMLGAAAVSTRHLLVLLTSV